jgi:hypothetical protein
MRAELNGVVLEGEFAAETVAAVREAVEKNRGVVVELTTRAKMALGSPAPIIGTYQGLWPGVQVLEGGHAKAAPTGSPWIDTNSGFVRSVRAWGPAQIWMANLPPAKGIIPGERYVQAVCDAAMAGARWVVAMDDDFARRLGAGEAAALRDWKRIAQHLKFYEDHRDWRGLEPFGRLALVQDPSTGSLLSGGILDMIAARHTPVRSVPPARMAASSFKGASMAVNVDPQALTQEQKDVLREFTRSGGTLLNGPPGWKSSGAQGGNRITLEQAELDRLNDIWRDINSMIGRRNLGVRLFNVSSMLSNLLLAPDGNGIVVELVNFSSYPVESITAHFLGKYRRARLYTPERGERTLEVYPTEEGTGVDIDRISVCATLRLD